MARQNSRYHGRTKELDYSVRYAENWRETCAIAHTAANGICCLCLSRPSKECHHVRYKDDRGAIAGREVAGRDIFPVCSGKGSCHERLHKHDAWVVCHIDPVFGNHQRSEFVEKLKFGYRMASRGVVVLKPLPKRRRRRRSA